MHEDGKKFSKTREGEYLYICKEKERRKFKVARKNPCLNTHYLSCDLAKRSQAWFITAKDICELESELGKEEDLGM